MLSFRRLEDFSLDVHPFSSRSAGVVTQRGFDSWGLPLTNGMAMGLATGFMKGSILCANKMGKLIAELISILAILA